MDLRLTVLLDAGRIPLARLPDWLRAARDGGATGVQLRDKQRPTREVYAYGRRLVDTAHDLGLWLAVNDRLDLALALGADVAHLGTSDLPPEAARRVAPALALGLSASGLAELEEAIAHGPAYIGFGPVFATPSKADSAAPVGETLLAEAVRRSPVPIVAIGGITPAAADRVWACGVHGLAVISAMAEAVDPADVRRRAEALCRAANRRPATSTEVSQA